MGSTPRLQGGNLGGRTSLALLIRDRERLLQQSCGHQHLHAALVVEVVGVEDDGGFANWDEDGGFPLVLAHDGLVDVPANRC